MVMQWTKVKQRKNKNQPTNKKPEETTDLKDDLFKNTCLSTINSK